MKKGILGIIALLISWSVFAQQDTLIWIGDEGITADEFIAVYNKNKDVGKDIDPKTPEEYRALFVNFKLKVKEAKEMGRDTLPDFVREFNGYRSQLAQPYLVDNTVDEKLYKEAYDRMQYEVRVKHIMVDLSMDALPKDTLVAYNKLLDLRKEILNGASFEDKAKEISTDTYSAVKGGDLGYFTVFNMVYPFETAAYTTPVGDISMPIRTKFGYHIIKVIDKRPSSGMVQVKHIFLISNEKTDEVKAAEAEVKAKEIYAKIEEGTEFELLVRQYSDDKNSVERGGLLPQFGINKMMPVFESKAFALENVGDVTEPFKTDIGWHIIKLVKKIPVGTYEEELPDIKEGIKGERASKGKNSLIVKLKEEYDFDENKKRLRDYSKVVDESFLKGQWDPAKAAKLSKTMFELDGKDYTQKEFTAYLNSQQRNAGKSETVEQEVYKLYGTWVNSEILAYENANLENKYPEFKILVNEYRDGILLFDLTEEKVWSKASKDSAGLAEFFKVNSRDYWWGERAEVAIVSCVNKAYAKKVLKLYYKGTKGNEILAELNKDSQLNVVIQDGTYSRGENPLVDKFEWKRGESEFFNEDERVKFIYYIAILQPEPRKLDESKGLVISDYQKQLEKEWIAELRAKYTVKVNEPLFNEIIKTID